MEQIQFFQQLHQQVVVEEDKVLEVLQDQMVDQVEVDQETVCQLLKQELQQVVLLVLVILLQQILLKEMLEKLEQVDIYLLVVEVEVLLVLVVLLVSQLLYLGMPQTVGLVELEHQTQF
jgi:hypothetical protein